MIVQTHEYMGAISRYCKMRNIWAPSLKVPIITISLKNNKIQGTKAFLIFIQSCNCNTLYFLKNNHIRYFWISSIFVNIPTFMMRKYWTKTRPRASWPISKQCIPISDVKPFFRSILPVCFVQCSTILSLCLVLFTMSSFPEQVHCSPNISKSWGFQDNFQYHSFLFHYLVLCL